MFMCVSMVTSMFSMRVGVGMHAFDPWASKVVNKLDTHGAVQYLILLTKRPDQLVRITGCTWRLCQVNTASHCLSYVNETVCSFNCRLWVLRGGGHAQGSSAPQKKVRNHVPLNNHPQACITGNSLYYLLLS